MICAWLDREKLGSSRRLRTRYILRTTGDLLAGRRYATVCGTAEVFNVVEVEIDNIHAFIVALLLLFNTISLVDEGKNKREKECDVREVRRKTGYDAPTAHNG